MTSVASALTALHGKLDEAKREAYWTALSAFLRFELSKSDFDKQATEALGPHVALHNEVILALLRDAQHAAAGGALNRADAAGLHIFGVPPSSQQSNGNGAAASSSAPIVAPQPSAAPKLKLMLKIGSDGQGGLNASAERPTLNVDPLDEQQLNALHERLLEHAAQVGLQGVQPEAVSFMHRAVRAVSNRLVVAAAAVRSESGSAVVPGEPRSLTAEDVQDAVRQQPHSAPWMTPPTQRASQNSYKFAA